MFNIISVSLIVVATAMITYQATKHGWASFIDDDKVNPEQVPQPKHYHDNGIDQVMSSKFPETLKDERKDA